MLFNKIKDIVIYILAYRRDWIPRTTNKIMRNKTRLNGYKYEPDDDFEHVWS